MYVPSCPVARYIVTVTMDCGSTGKSNGSETARAPSGMIMEVSPPLNVTVCRVDGWIALTPAEPLYGRAIDTPVTGRSVRPNALEMRIRICEAPVDVCSVWRMVLL